MRGPIGLGYSFWPVVGPHEGTHRFGPAPMRGPIGSGYSFLSVVGPHEGIHRFGL